MIQSLRQLYISQLHVACNSRMLLHQSLWWLVVDGILMHSIDVHYFNAR